MVCTPPILNISLMIRVRNRVRFNIRIKVTKGQDRVWVGIVVGLVYGYGRKYFHKINNSFLLIILCQ